jgi:hypothetical protein
LQDHLHAGISFGANEYVHTVGYLLRRDPTAVQAAMVAYQANKTGPFCSAGVNSFAFIPVAGFLSTDSQETLAQLLEQDDQDQAIHKLPVDQVRKELVHHILQTPDEASGTIFSFSAQPNTGRDVELKSLTADMVPGNFISLAVVLLHPRSTENVHITSPDPAKEHVRLGAISNGNATDTCSMMPRAKGGVVNARLIVHGAKNLRVVDASIMPMVLQNNTQSSVHAIAERAADFIKLKHIR